MTRHFIRGSELYLNTITEKLKEVLISVLPITIIVLLLHFTLTPLETPSIIKFLIGTLLIILGLSLFLIGIDIGITPLGNLIGSTLIKTNKIWIICIAGALLGFFISVAEPGLLVLANQVGLVTLGEISSISILVVVSVGLAIMLALGLIRILYNVPLYKILSILYFITFILALFTSSEFLTISFDASGATTGVLAVPFILALTIGVSVLKKDSKASEEDSFGLVAIASVGAIISVMILDVFSKGDHFSSTLEFSMAGSNSITEAFVQIIPSILKESFFSLLPLLIIFLFFQRISFHLNKKTFKRILKGFAYTFIGLFIFLVGVNAGFMDLGSIIGQSLANLNNNYYIIGIGFILGFVTILAEPAVYVLTHQIEDVTSGYVKRSSVLIALSVGVGFAVALSVIRILIPELQLWHYLLPGYLIAIIMTCFVPKLFVGIAFDAGGVATGPMTATFILAFTHGAADATDGASILIDGFGMIALVALTPIITLLILGLIFKINTRKGGLEINEK
jgi:hypothetical protein